MSRSGKGPRGTLIIDRQFPGVGRIKRASGTKSQRMRRRLNEMLTSLFGAGRLEILEQIRDGNLHLMVVFRHYRAGHWDDIPTAQHLQPMAATLEDWAKTYPCSEKHRQSLGRSITSIANSARKDATINDLPVALTSFRKDCIRTDHARTFNLARSAAQAFLRSTVGKQDRLWLAVSTIQTIRANPKYQQHPKTVEEARAIAEQLGLKAGAMWWTLCTTGMGPKEYFEDGFEVRQDRILIRGQKRKGRNRPVPRIAIPVRPSLTRSGFRQALRRTGEGVTPRDGRATYANWMEAAAIPRTRRRMYLGHGAKDVTDLYERYEVEAFLKEDADRLGGYIGGNAQLRVVR